VKVGQPVTFTAEVEVPKGMGKVVAAAWHFEGQLDDMSNRNGWVLVLSHLLEVLA
jgi:hypothetical protein